MKYFFLTVLVIVTACGGSQAPENLLSPVQMTKVLTEVHLLESKVRELGIQPLDSAQVVYDHYEMHYDFSGFSKKRFMEEADYGFDDLKWINEISELTVFALRSNMGRGSIVLVMFVSDVNLNLLIFSNNVVEGDFNYIPNDEYDRGKFENWLKTLMN